MGHYIVYVLYSSRLNRYYKGSTEDLEDRIRRHNAGYEHSTKSGVPWELAWFTEKESRSEVMAFEKMLKNMNRVKLEDFIKRYP